MGHDVVGDIKLLVSEAVRIGVRPMQLLHLRKILCTKELSVGVCRLPLPSHLQYEHPCDALLERMYGGSPGGMGLCTYKWPTLSECYDRIVSHATMPPSHSCHDARGTGHALRWRCVLST